MIDQHKKRKMKTNVSFFILLITEFIVFCSSNENIEKKAFQEPDLRVNFVHDGGVFQLTAFKSPENDKILAENNSKNYGKLRWYSIGYPLLVKRLTLTKSKDNEYFNFTKSGFYARIQMLTDEHRRLFIEEVKHVYNISLRMNQIDHLILSSLKCFIPMHDKTEIEVILY